MDPAHGTGIACAPTESHESVSTELKQSVVDYYEARLHQHGATAEGMDWKDAASQRMRFTVLCDICDLNGLSVHEVGAGAAHLHDFLREHSPDARYSGSDLSAEMVRAARERLPNVDLVRYDILNEPNLPTHDVVLCSGLFHVKLDHNQSDWWCFCRDMIQRMYQMCRVGIAFNMMTDHVDFRAERLWYSNPGETLDFCRRELSRWVSVRHDYPLYEYTTYVYRETARQVLSTPRSTSSS